MANDTSRIVRFAAICAAVLVLALVAAWLSGLAGGLGLDGNGVVALGIGITLTCGLGVGLMALVFYSDRSGNDR